MANYNPPAASLSVLGPLAGLLPSVQALPLLSGANFIGKLGNGTIFFDSKLYIDTDGSSLAAQDNTGQNVTSLRDDAGNSVDANAVPYFVLPGGFETTHQIRLGDLGVVIFGSRAVPAIFADSGPTNKIGEGSVALHRALGRDPVDNKGVFHDNGLEPDDHVLTFVFPGSGNGKPRTPAEIAQLGNQQLVQLKAAVAAAGAIQWGIGLVPSLLSRLP